ncbi:MAG: GntR family transcriptional regulator [Syntrophaceae bacterium]|nr:GntR family transcriptional regulator [Syntrophaceae bacterium]
MKASTIQERAVIVPPNSISDQIYEVLKERILLGKIAPGERIIENSIAESLKTSRTPVREAFQRLVQDGLAERVPQGGVRATIITPRMVREIFGIRAVLEVYAVELACDQIDAETIRKLKELARQARKLLSSPEANRLEELISLWKINTSFHETIYRATGSEYLLKLIDQLNCLVRRFRFLSMRKTRIQAWDQHELIIRYLEDRNKRALVELMKAHIEHAASDTLKALENDRWEKDV